MPRGLRRVIWKNPAARPGDLGERPEFFAGPSASWRLRLDDLPDDLWDDWVEADDLEVQRVVRLRQPIGPWRCRRR